MAVPMARAFFGTQVAGPDAGFQLGAQHRDVPSRAADREPGGRRADVGAVQAGPDALAHVHVLGRAGIGAGRAHEIAEHGVARRRRQRLVEIPGDVRMQGDHLMDGHHLTRFRACGA